MKLFLLTLLNGLSLSALYFIVASGFTLIFGLMRTVNLAHGAIYLFGAYMGYEVSQLFDSWVLAVMAGFISATVLSTLIYMLFFHFLKGDELRQTLVSLGIAIVMSDLMLNIWGGGTYQFEASKWLQGVIKLPLVKFYPTYRLFLIILSIFVGLGLMILINKTRLGILIRAGVDDEKMLSATGINVNRIFLLTFAIGGGIVGLSGVIGGTALSIAPGEDYRYLLSSLVVVIVGGMGSLPGTAIGSLLIGLAEQFGLAYSPTYGVLYTFIIMIVILIWKPEGLSGKKME